MGCIAFECTARCESAGARAGEEGVERGCAGREREEGVERVMRWPRMYIIPRSADLGSSDVAVISGSHHVGAKRDYAGRRGAGGYERRERRSEPRADGYQ